jgi:hypothetical protein
MMRRENDHRGEQGRTVHSVLFFVLPILVLSLSAVPAIAQLAPADVLILVNATSPTSCYIAKLYRQYYPAINESQVLYLTGLADCSGPSSTPASEIISRQQYNDFIAIPVRNYIADPAYPERLGTIKVIITTAGLPYRIEDTDPASADIIYPNGSTPSLVGGHQNTVDAASVESELTCLWYSDYVQNPAGIDNRIVNVYEGYRQSGVSLFERFTPGTKTMMWVEACQTFGSPSPIMEGENDCEFPPSVYGAINRSFNAGDIYLTCRLDGPKDQGKSAVFAVRAMLERAKRASSPAKGVNPLQAVVVLDDAPSKSLDRNRIYNLNGSMNYVIYDPIVNQPPDAITILTRDDYVESFSALTNESVVQNGLSIGGIDYGQNLCAMLDRRAGYKMTQTDIDAYAVTDPNRAGKYQGVIALATFGVNGDDSRPSNYLLTGGPNSTSLFNCVNGAVFTSIESFNALTMFSNVQTLPTAQGKIVDFITIGGSAAIGHAFEPVSEAVVDNLYLHYNLLADETGDGIADLTFVEAAFTSIPFLSWAEVVIGDPLMRIAYGPGGKAWQPFAGDINLDGRVNSYDVYLVRRADGGVLNTTDPVFFDRYNDLCDINQDGRVNSYDVYLARRNDGAIAP